MGDVADCFPEFRHFGAIEAQIWLGNKAMQLPSHKDGATSLLHLGLTLGGQRTLRVGTFPSDSSASPSLNPKEENVWNERLWGDRLTDVTMTPGSAYVSSPFCFEHAVKYENTASPVIALQFRMAYTQELGTKLNKERSDDMLEVIKVVSHCLHDCSQAGVFRMPSLVDLKDAETRIERWSRVRAKAKAKGA